MEIQAYPEIEACPICENKNVLLLRAPALRVECQACRIGMLRSCNEFTHEDHAGGRERVLIEQWNAVSRWKRGVLKLAG